MGAARLKASEIGPWRRRPRPVRQAVSRSMSSLLFITSTRIGDAALSTGALALAREMVPGARVTIACGPLAAPLFRAEPGLDALVVMTKQARGGHWWKLWRALIGKRFDVAVDLRGSAVTYLIRARRRFVFRPRSAGHKLDEFAALLGAKSTPEMKIHLDARAQAEADVFLGGARRFLALGPAANWIGKTWARKNFAALACNLAGPSGPLADAPVVLLGGPDEMRVVDALRAELVADGLGVIATAGALDLLACAAVLERAALFVGNDSGLMHMSGAMRTPTLGLFGPTDERVYGPRGPRARSIRGARSYEDVHGDYAIKGGGASLMDDLKLDAVISTAREMLAR